MEPASRAPLSPLKLLPRAIMDLSGLLVQMLNGFADASSLFMAAAGLSLIFGVTRIVNFAHGSFFMVGAYLSYSTIKFMGNPLWFWPALVIVALSVGILGALIEVPLLRRIYRAPELLQLLATYAVMMVIQDVVLWTWGPLDLVGPRVPGLAGSVKILARKFPTYDLFLIVVAPLILASLWLLITRTRWGRLVRAATQDREMVSALGINQAWLFTAVFVLGTMLAGLGGALRLPKDFANLGLAISTITSVFVVVVVGGMGSIPGAYVAALLIALVKALCVWLGIVHIFGLVISFPKFTLVVEFVIMAIVLVVRPYGLFGRPQVQRRIGTSADLPLRGISRNAIAAAAVLLGILVLAPMISPDAHYVMVFLIEILIASLFAASLHFLMGPGGMYSFGHAVYFGIRCLWCRTARSAPGNAHGSFAVAGACRCRRRRPPFRLVLRPPVRRLSGNAYFGLRTNSVGGGVPVGGVHRWQQRDHRRLARVMVGGQAGLLLSHTGPHRRWSDVPVQGGLFTVRICPSRRAQLDTSVGSHRHQRQAHPVGRLRICRHDRRSGRRLVRVFQGQHFA